MVLARGYMSVLLTTPDINLDALILFFIYRKYCRNAFKIFNGCCLPAHRSSYVYTVIVSKQPVLFHLMNLALAPVI